MKKVFTLLLVMMIFITGCSLTKMEKPSPKEKVEEYLDSYKDLDSNLLDDLEDLVEDMASYTDSQKERYNKLMKKHYKDLEYEIKGETIDGDDATVEVEINVYDYSKVLNKKIDMDEYKQEDDKYDFETFYDDQLEMLEAVDEKVKYTIVFELTKIDDEWIITEPSETVKQKIHGIYKY